MLKSTSKRTGRPRAVFKDRHGNQIDGLMQLADGRWRISGPEKYTFTESNEDLAIARLKDWQAQKSGTKSNLGEVIVHPDAHSASWDEARRTIAAGGSLSTSVEVIPGGHGFVVADETLNPRQWAWLKRQIIARPAWVALQSGVEQIGYLSDLKAPTPSPTLREVGELYLTHAKITDNWRAKNKMFWREFVESVGVTKLREIEQQHIVEYADAIHEAGQAPTYARQRFGAIKTIINYPSKRGKWSEDAKRALALCSVLVKPRQSSMNPKPVTPEEFKRLFDAADVTMRAVLLLALNCCMYGAEVAALDWSELDLDKRTLVTSRNKTKVIRVAMLWAETIDALRKLPRRAESLFLTEAGTKADSLSLYRLFKIVRKAAGLPELQFSQIRDTSYTTAVEAGVDLDTCRLLAGHATGISDHYVRRAPRMVARACEAIHAAYSTELKPSKR